MTRERDFGCRYCPSPDPAGHQESVGMDSRAGLCRYRRLSPNKMVFWKGREHITAETGATSCRGVYEGFLKKHYRNASNPS